MKEFIPFDETQLDLLEQGYRLVPLNGVMMDSKTPTVSTRQKSPEGRLPSSAEQPQ